MSLGTLLSRDELESHQIETQLGISLSFPVENRNLLAWVLPTLSACPTYTGRRARLGRAWGPVIGRSASGASPGWCQGASHDFCAASLGLRVAEAWQLSFPVENRSRYRNSLA